MSTLPAPFFASAYYFGSSVGQPVEAIAPEDKAEKNEPLERDRLLTAMPAFADYCADAPPPTLPWLRVMRTHPMIEFAFSLVRNPIVAGTRNLVIREQDGTDAPPRKVMPGLKGATVGDSPEDKRKKLAEDVFEPLWADALTGLEALNFGYWLQEVLWDRWMGVTAPVRFKSFLPWDVELRRDNFNDFAGFKLLAGDPKDNERDSRYAFHTVCNPQFHPLTGWPRAANALRSWWRYVKSHENCDRIEQKASGRQMLMLLANGKTQKNADTGLVEYTKEEAQGFANAAARGEILQAPMFAFNIGAIKGNKDLAAIPAMKIEPIDWGDTGPSLLASIHRRAELAVEIVRAYNRPEREAMEGHHGTKAEAGAHGAVGTTDSELVGAAFYNQFNVQVMNRYLATNYGPTAIDAMYWKMGPLADPLQTFKQEVIKALLSSPTTGPDVERHVDKRDLLKGSELPLIPEDQVPELPAMPADAGQADGGGGGTGDPLAKRNGQTVAGANGNGN